MKTMNGSDIMRFWSHGAPVQPDAMAKCQKRKEYLLRTAISFSKWMNLVQGSVGIGHAIQYLFEWRPPQMMPQCCLETFKGSITLNPDTVRCAKMRNPAKALF